MELAQLRINRTPVNQNSKCEGCVHYDGNAQAKGGACEVGQAPALCGGGGEPKYGYAPLADLSPDEIDDLATPLVTGDVGVMNEHGETEPKVAMKRVVLGDEDLSIAKRIEGQKLSAFGKSIGFAQGEVNKFAGAELYAERTKYGADADTRLYEVAKSLRDLHFAPRKQRMYSLEDVLDFLKSSGMDVKETDYAAAGIVKSSQTHGAGWSGNGRAALPIQPGAKGHVPEVWEKHGPQAKGVPAAAPAARPSRKPHPFASTPDMSGTQTAMGNTRKSLHNYQVGDKVHHDAMGGGYGAGTVARANPNNPAVTVKFGKSPPKPVPHTELKPHAAGIAKSTPNVTRIK